MIKGRLARVALFVYACQVVLLWVFCVLVIACIVKIYFLRVDLREGPLLATRDANQTISWWAI